MKLKDNESFHFGVYGICIDDGKILMIKKARGPYKGTYDLPGGSLEYGEHLDEAIEREMMEETGRKILDKKFLGLNMYLSSYVGSRGDMLSMHHIGAYYIANLAPGDIKTTADGEDSLGAEYISLDKISEIKIAPIAEPMIKQAIEGLEN